MDMSKNKNLVNYRLFSSTQSAEEPDVEKNMDAYKKHIMPVFLLMLMNRSQFLESLPEMVENLKYHRYEEAGLESHLRAGIDLREYEKENFLMNKMHFGDILWDSGKNEFLLCITPPCDSFRPQKIDYKYTFIRGQEIRADEMKKTQRENIHITVCPIERQPDAKKETVYIKWKLFEVITFDLGDKAQYENLCGYIRQYRLDEVYARQIANKFLSHFSRAGVDEIFAKREGNLMSLFG